MSGTVLSFGPTLTPDCYLPKPFDEVDIEIAGFGICPIADRGTLKTISELVDLALVVLRGPRGSEFEITMWRPNPQNLKVKLLE
jgi:hypothetical protein